MAPAIQIVCHRGANEYAPENTFASAALCIDWQMDYLEIDVNTSRDGVMYVFHGPDLARTTNGEGRIDEMDSHEMDQLDCGRWFNPSFAGERVPRLQEFLRWVDHRIRIFFDVKFADLDQLVALVRALDMQDECFFWFGREKHAHAFHALKTGLALKINVESAAEVSIARTRFDAAIVEFSLANMSEDMRRCCETEHVKSMILQRPYDVAAYRSICDWGVDMVNVDHGDRFSAFLQGVQSEP